MTVSEAIIETKVRLVSIKEMLQDPMFPSEHYNRVSYTYQCLFENFQEFLLQIICGKGSISKLGEIMEAVEILDSMIWEMLNNRIEEVYILN